MYCASERTHPVLGAQSRVWFWEISSSIVLSKSSVPELYTRKVLWAQIRNLLIWESSVQIITYFGELCTGSYLVLIALFRISLSSMEFCSGSPYFRELGAGNLLIRRVMCRISLSLMRSVQCALAHWARRSQCRISLSSKSSVKELLIYENSVQQLTKFWEFSVEIHLAKRSVSKNLRLVMRS